MGCGRSKLQSIYPRKASAKNKETHEDGGEQCVVENGVAVVEPSDGIEDEETAEARRAAAIAKSKQIASGPLLAMAEISTSQLEFFRMLDEKIANGPDYDSATEENVSISSTPRTSTSSSRPVQISLQQNGHKPSGVTKLLTHNVLTSSPTRSRTPTKSPTRNRLPTLQASPPPHEQKNINFHISPVKTAFNMKHRPTS